MPGKPEQQHESEINQLAMKMVESIGPLVEAMPSTVEKVGKIEETVKGLGESTTKFHDRVEQIAAQLDGIKSAIRNNRHNGLFVPGLEDDDASKSFSMIRACSAVKAGGSKEAFEKVGAGYEHEVLEATRAVAQKSGHVMGVDSAGGYFVGDQMLADVIPALYARSVMINLGANGTTRCRVLDGLRGSPVRLPKFERGMIAYWVGEENEYAESRSKVGNLKFEPHKLGILTKITDEQRRFAVGGYEALFRNDMRDCFAEKIDYTAFYGTGTENCPRGITRMVDIQVIDAADSETAYDGIGAARAGVADWAETDITFDLLDDMKGALEDADIQPDENGSFAYIAHNRAFRKLKRLKIDNYSGQLTGQPYLLGAPMLSDAKLRDLIGEYDKSTQIASASVPGASISGTTTETNTNCGDLFAGNWSELIFGRWSGIEIVSDDGIGAGFTSDSIIVKMRMYCDFQHRQPKALVLCPNAKIRG